LSTIDTNRILPLIYSFLNLFSLATPLIYQNILISTTPILYSILFSTLNINNS
jgi:hypothetical protein